MYRYKKLLTFALSVNPGNNPYNNCLFREIPSNIDLRQVFDVGYYSPVLPSKAVIIGSISPELKFNQIIKFDELIFVSLRLGHTIKTNSIKFPTIDPEIYRKFRKGSGNSFSTKF